MTYYSEIVDSLGSAKKFCNMNKIEPYMVVVIWNEDDEEKHK